MTWPLRRDEPAIRLLTPDDAETCARLHGTGFAHPWSAAEFESLLSSSAVRGMAAALHNGTIVGFILARMAATEAEILTVIVDQSRRRLGLGHSLMTDQLSGLAAQGVQSVVLEVDENNAPARALYKRLGFSQVGARSSYYRRQDGSPSNALILRCAL